MKKKALWMAGSIALISLLLLASFTGMVLARRHHESTSRPPEVTAVRKKPPAKSHADAPVITAHAAIMLDLDKNKILYEKNADEWMYPASVTKIVTALLAIEYGHPEQQVVISKNAADTEDTYLNEGDVLRLKDLITEMMVISDNGAAVAIAETVAGSEAAFAQKMNEKARSFGAKRTNFVNPNGLPHGNHITTARDLLLIAEGCWKNGELRRIAGTIKQEIYWIQPKEQMLLVENTNDLLEDYPGTLGLKTGWTNAAGGCLAAVCKRNGTTLMTITLQSESGDDRFTDTARLFDYGFSKRKK